MRHAGIAQISNPSIYLISFYTKPVQLSSLDANYAQIGRGLPLTVLDKADNGLYLEAGCFRSVWS